VKRCNLCNYVKPLTEFYFEKDKKTLKGACKICITARSRKWQEDNPEQYKSNQLQLKYGITLEEKIEMIKQQGNRCAICEDVFQNDKATHVDHCHKTKDIRAILCHHCNTCLGHFKDSKKLLKEAIKYLGEHAQKRTAALISTGHNIQGELYPELGSFSAAGTWEDSYDLDHYQRTVRGEDSDYRTQTRGGDSVGYGGQQVATPKPPQSEQDNWELHPTYGWLERAS
jgi:hypothetical protein